MPAAAVLTAAALGPGSPRRQEVVKPDEADCPGLSRVVQFLAFPTRCNPDADLTKKLERDKHRNLGHYFGGGQHCTEEEICHNHVASEAGQLPVVQYASSDKG